MDRVDEFTERKQFVQFKRSIGISLANSIGFH